MKQLSMTDSGFLVAESPRTPSHLCVANIYDPATTPGGAPTFDQILEAIAERLPAAPTFRRKLVRVPLGLDRPWWVEDEDFDLEFHLRHLALPKPGDWRQFRTQVGRLHARPLDLTRPPWEMTVIDGLDGIEGLPPGCFATVLKVHHSAIDGVSGVELISAIHQTDPSPPPPAPPDTWSPEPSPPGWALLAKAALHGVTRPLAMTRLLVSNAVPMARELPRHLTGGGRTEQIARTRFNHRISAHRVWDDVSCPLADVKRARRAVDGATLNDLCLAIVGEAMRTYLSGRGELPSISLVAAVPVSTRTPEQAGTGGNQISVMRVSLHTDIEDPVERLAAVAATTREKKAAQDGVLMPVLLQAVQQLPGALIGVAARAMATAPGAPFIANTWVTNVPGSPVPLYFLGAKLVHSTGCVPLVDGLGLFHCVSSYGEQFRFMFTACPDLLPDPDTYRDHLAAAVDTYLAASKQ